ncbi:MAG TPA: HAD hydrolase family protein, partial [Candidatus Dormibacteraeota bacterium]|nr:HAD hydrolase family protein [Candidatus Dormibacteraeota bacterium]
MPTRLLALDLDGTLINDALQMAPRDEEAVKAAVAAGVHVVLATGRMFRSALPYAERLGLT